MMTNKDASVQETLQKELILAKKLLQSSEQLIEINSVENNLVAVHNLNSALNIVLRCFGKRFKISSIKQMNDTTLENQWIVLSDEYKKRYGADLSMKTQIFTLNNIITDFVNNSVYPTNSQVRDLAQALTIFLEDFILKVFNLKYHDLDLHLLIENPQVRSTLKQAKASFESDNHEEVMRSTSAGFQIALEDQRHRINYLSEKGYLKPELLMLDKAVNIHIDPEDEDFIHLLLKTPQKDLERFKQLVPTALITGTETGPEVVVSDFVEERVLTRDNAMFCLNFVFETVLQWQERDLVINE